MCGILGVMATTPVNQLLYDGLMVLQHRGQDAAGIATGEGNTFHLHKGRGWCATFSGRATCALPGNVGIGHCAIRRPVRPQLCRGPALLRQFAVRHRARPQRQPDQRRATEGRDVPLDRRHINTNSDSEVLLNVLAHELQSAAHGYELDVDSIFRRWPACIGAVAAPMPSLC